MLSLLCRLLHVRHGLWDEMMRRGVGGGDGSKSRVTFGTWREEKGV